MPKSPLALRRGRALWCALCLACAGCAPAGPPDVVLLVTADTLRADHLGAYGADPDLTPVLDALAERSLRFTTAYAPASYTLPSVAALLTGRWPEEVGALGNRSSVRDDAVTLAGVLRLYDWVTGAVVSNFVLRRGRGIESGFDHYDDEYPQKEAHRKLPERTAAATTDAGLRMLDRLLAEASGRAGGVLLWVHYQDPHGPYEPPPGRREHFLERERSRPDGRRELPLPEGFRGLGSIPDYQYFEGQREAAWYRAGYAGEIQHMDEQIGRLFEGVRERGLDPRAAVVFTADHGEGLGEDDYWFAHGEYLSDAVVRIPLLIRAPGLAPGQRDDLASLVDLFPTVLSLVGLEVPGAYPGRNLLAPGAEQADPFVYVVTGRAATVPRFALIQDGAKYVLSAHPDEPSETIESIGGPDSSLGEAPRARMEAMREALQELRGRFARSPLPAPSPALSEEEREMLRRLGYAE